MKPIFKLNGRMAAARPSKLATTILTASSVAVIAECREPIMDNMHTRPNVPFVAMFTEQMDPTCTKDDVPSVRMGLRGSSTGRPSTDKYIWFQLRRYVLASMKSIHGVEKKTEKYPSWQSVNENSLPLKRRKGSGGRKST